MLSAVHGDHGPILLLQQQPGRASQGSAGATRKHWNIENSSHRFLDVTFWEDDSRVRKDHGPQNLAVLRQIALNLLKHQTTLERGIQGKRLKAGWVEGYPLNILLD